MGSLSVFALGGLGEVGMNCLALEQRGELLLVDCGGTFEHRGLGIDVLHPDFGALESYRGRIAGLFVTHGHEDHIGAIPYLLSQFPMPVWAPAHAMALIRERLTEYREMQWTHKRPIDAQPMLHEASVRGVHHVGSFWVEPIRVTHSIADATALAIKTDAGVVIHTGDFKFDATPPDGEAFDIDRIDELGEEGVALLMSDSTNIDAQGETGSERSVGDSLHRITAKATGAVVVALFASNVHRQRMLGEIARHTKRKLVLLGRSVQLHADVARQTRYLDWPSDLVHPVDRVQELPRSQVLAIASGTQGEWRGALSRIARGDHMHFDLAQGDTVVISSRTIPGNDLAVFGVIGQLIRRGVQLHTWISDREIHVSGHAHRQEQKRMLELVRPKAFIPVHGTLHHLTRQCRAVAQRGWRFANLRDRERRCRHVADEGAGLRKTGKVNVGRVACFMGAPTGAPQLRERVIMAGEGVVVVTVVRRSAAPADVHGHDGGTVESHDRRSLGRRAPSGARCARRPGRRRAGGARSLGRAPRLSRGDRLQARHHRDHRRGFYLTRLPPTHVFLSRQMRALMSRLAETMPRVRHRADGEAIHDMRVALRKLRVVLKVARPILGRYHVDAIRQAFTRVHRASGALRDEEVLRETLADLDVSSAELDAWMARRAVREEALRRLVEHRLRAGDLRRPMRLLDRALALPVDPGKRPTLPLIPYARKIVDRARREVDGLRDVGVDDVAGLHALRIAYKRLRYSIETFTDALPLDVAALAEPATRFQKRLGDIHDLDVAAAVMTRARTIDDVRGRLLHAVASRARGQGRALSRRHESPARSTLTGVRLGSGV